MKNFTEWFYHLRVLCFQAEGVPQEYSETLFIRRADTDADSGWTLDVNLPDMGLVQGSEYVKVTAIGK